MTGQPVTGLIELTEAGDTLHVGNVAVHPSVQGTGIGRQLMDFAERRAILHGLTRLSLYTNEVMTENQAIYTHLGYREVAGTPKTATAASTWRSPSPSPHPAPPR